MRPRRAARVASRRTARAAVRRRAARGRAASRPRRPRRPARLAISSYEYPWNSRSSSALALSRRNRAPSARVSSSSETPHHYAPAIAITSCSASRSCVASTRPRRRRRLVSVVADVLRDLEEPCQLVLGNDPATETALCVEECRLQRVLGFLTRAEPTQAETEDPRRVPLVELGGRVTGRRLGEAVLTPTHFGTVLWLLQEGVPWAPAA